MTLIMSWYLVFFNVFLFPDWIDCTAYIFNDFNETRIGCSLNLLGIFSNPHRIKSLDLGSNKHIYSLNLLITGAKGSATSFSFTRPKSFNYNWSFLLVSIRQICLKTTCRESGEPFLKKNILCLYISAHMNHFDPVWISRIQNKFILVHPILVSLKSLKMYAGQSFHILKKLLKAPSYHYIYPHDESIYEASRYIPITLF